MRVRRLAAAGTAALLLPFAACSDGKSNAEPTAPTTSAAPSPSETAPEGPTLPPEAQGDDEAAAKAFVKFYFELISEAMVTGETQPLLTYSASRCGSCAQLAEKIDALYDAGESMKTKGWQPTKFVHEQPAPTSHVFYLRVRVHAQRLYEGDRLIKRDPPNLVPMRVVAIRKGGSWRLDWLENLQ